MTFSVDRIEGDKVLLLNEEGAQIDASMDDFDIVPHEGMLFEKKKGGRFAVSEAQTAATKAEAAALLQKLLDKPKQRK